MALQDALGAPNDQDTAFHNEKLSRVRLEPTFRRLPVAAPSVSDALLRSGEGPLLECIFVPLGLFLSPLDTKYLQLSTNCRSIISKKPILE